MSVRVPLRSFFLASLLAAFAAANPAPALAQGCPGNRIQNFQAELLGCEVTNNYKLSWALPSISGATFQVLRSGPYDDYCEVPDTPAFTIVGSTSGTTFTVSSLTLNKVFVYQVQVSGCPSTRADKAQVVDTFTTPPVLSIRGTQSGESQVSLTYSADGRTFAVGPMERTNPDGSIQNVVGLVQSFQNYCPPNEPLTLTDNGLARGSYRYRLRAVGNAATCYEPVSLSTAVQVVECQSPDAPVVSVPGLDVLSGRTLAVAWSAAGRLLPGGSYVVELSRNGFQTIEASASTTGLSAMLPTPRVGGDTAFGVRVRAVQPCGPEAVSTTVNVTLKAHSEFLLLNAGPSWVVGVNGASPTAEVKVKNVGSRSGHVTFTASAPFFSVSPSSLDLGSGASGSVVLTANREFLTSPGFQQGFLIAATDTGNRTTPVLLRVVPSTAPTGATVRANVASVLFNADQSVDPAPQTITLNASGGRGTAYLAATVGPGGAWLVVGPEIAQGVDAGSGQLTLTLSVKRSQRDLKEGSIVRRTLLTLNPVGGDPNVNAAVLEVIDSHTLSIRGATGIRAGHRQPLASTPTGGSSFILPTAVKAQGAGGEIFTSDAWVRNFSSTGTNIDLFCTVDGANGVSGTAGNVLTSIAIPPYSIIRTSDLMSSIFRVPLGVSANIEARSPSVNLLSVRSTADSVKGADPASRFGTEIPIASFGSGAKLGDPELIVPGADADDLNRVNLILAETFGAAADVRITVNGPAGNLVNTVAASLQPFSKTQINSASLVPPGVTLSGGWLGVTVTGGAGHVFPVATVIDNRSGSFSAVLGQGVHPAPAERRGALAGIQTYLLPTVARTVGQFNTQFITNMSVVNGTGSNANLTLVYRYVDQDDGNTAKVASKALVLPPRGSLAKALGSDMIRNFFGITNRSFGSIYMTGDLSRITGVASVAALVDPLDASKGLKSAQVLGIYTDSSSIMDAGEQATRFGGVEQSDQKRTNLILIEVDGKPAEVTVRMYGPNGEELGEKTYPIGANQYRQINTVVTSDDGLAAGDGPFQNVEVATQVVSGGGRVVALASVIDNVSRNPEIFLLTPPAPPSDPTIGF